MQNSRTDYPRPTLDYVHPDDHTQPTCEMTPGFKSFHKKMKAALKLAVFWERNVRRFEETAWGRGKLHDKGQSGCEGLTTESSAEAEELYQSRSVGTCLMIGLSFRFCFRQSGFHLIVNDRVINGVKRKWNRSDSFDSDSVALMTLLTMPIFDFRKIISALREHSNFKITLWTKKLLFFGPVFGPFSTGMAILEDPGADNGGEGKSKRAGKYGTKKSKELRKEPLGTMSYQTIRR